ncbi:hypothetical protein ACH474_31810 [Nocardia rhamnosiphila]|uniref:Uncharacterized protein n=1 Tax=Nocardia rhamnosiphila TaxID=426716 RepID=A0ABV2WVQ6_9NOCA|nr:hypothetical protein [Nocardia rhamnosiphila]
MADEFTTPECFDSVLVSTPLCRAVRRLRAVLPVGWRVDVVAHGDPAHRGAPVVRALPATD